MSEWRTDMDKAPRGRMEPSVRMVNGKERRSMVSVQEYVWLATKCGKVVLSSWLEPTKWSPARWEMLGEREDPVAWRPYTPGEFPVVYSSEGEKRVATYPNGRGPEYPCGTATQGEN